MLARRQIPNLLTGARVMAVPLCLVVIALNPDDQARCLLGIFILASVTDFFDGYLARRWNVTSTLGALLDPIADKLLVALMLLYLLAEIPADFLPQPMDLSLPMILFVAVALIVLRELYIAGLREFMASRQRTLPVSRGGKWKTALQMIAILLMLTAMARLTCTECVPPLDTPIYLLGLALLCVSALLAVTSAVGYTRAAIKQ